MTSVSLICSVIPRGELLSTHFYGNRVPQPSRAHSDRPPRTQCTPSFRTMLLATIRFFVDAATSLSRDASQVSLSSSVNPVTSRLKFGHNGSRSARVPAANLLRWKKSHPSNYPSHLACVKGTNRISASLKMIKKKKKELYIDAQIHRAIARALNT